MEHNTNGSNRPSLRGIYYLYWCTIKLICFYAKWKALMLAEKIQPARRKMYLLASVTFGWRTAVMDFEVNWEDDAGEMPRAEKGRPNAGLQGRLYSEWAQVSLHISCLLPYSFYSSLLSVLLRAARTDANIKQTRPKPFCGSLKLRQGKEQGDI